MNPFLAKFWPYILIGVLVLALAGMTKMYFGEHDALVSYQATITQMGKDAKEEVAKAKKEGEDNLKSVKANHENQRSQIQKDAVRNYLSANPARRVCGEFRGGSLPNNGADKFVDDGTQSESISTDQRFIQSCADDANKVGAFQLYCTLNHCPIEE